VGVNRVNKGTGTADLIAVAGALFAFIGSFEKNELEEIS